MNIDAPTIGNLATRQNALRIAQNRFDLTGLDQAVVATGNPDRPFVVEDHRNQANIIDAVIGAGDDLDLIQHRS